MPHQIPLALVLSPSTLQRLAIKIDLHKGVYQLILSPLTDSFSCREPKTFRLPKPLTSPLHITHLPSLDFNKAKHLVMYPTVPPLLQLLQKSSQLEGNLKSFIIDWLQMEYSAPLSENLSGLTSQG